MKIARAEFDTGKLTRYLGKFVTHPVLFGVRVLSYLMPRSKNIWVLGHPTKFDGNSKYFFLYAQNMRDKGSVRGARGSVGGIGGTGGVRVVWMTRNRELAKELRSRGYDAVLLLSPAGIWLCLRAKFHITDTSLEALNYWLAGGAKVIDLFHALPIKKMEQDVLKGDSTEVTLFHSKGLVKLMMRFLFPWRFVKPAFVPSSSPLYTDVFSSMFQLSKEHIKETGIPRNDVLFFEISGTEIGLDENAYALVKEAKSKGAKIAMYAPTFRDTGDQHSFLQEGESLQKLNVLMQNAKAVFLVKIHPFMKIKIPEGKYGNILFANPNTDSYPLLKLADTLITDYSSIFVDFLLLNRPEIFFAYDLEKYMTKDRELYFDYNDFTPGPKARTFDEFLLVLEKTLQGQDEFKQKREQQLSLCFTHQDGNASQRIFELLKTL